MIDPTITIAEIRQTHGSMRSLAAVAGGEEFTLERV
jgi:hypothetical protein